MTGIALCYEPRPNAFTAQMAGVLAAQGLRVKRVGPGDLSRTVGELAGLPGPETAPEPAGDGLKEPAVIFCGVTEQTLDRALTALRRARYRGLKAVLTEHNKDWPLGRLFAELLRERAAIARSGVEHNGA